MAEIIKTNSYQTPITEELLDRYPDEVRDQFMDFIDTVPMLKWMIGERPRAKDLPRDEKGRIIVDIAHPHILENMDYFRPAAKYYEEFGCYTLLKKNPNPKSEYMKWFNEEVRRCREGYVRESDGEWVTGQMYWYLNYVRIMLNRFDEEEKIYIRVEDFPDFWEGIYYRFHYYDQARRAGKHCVELARRGASKSFCLASTMSHNLLFGESTKASHRITTVLTAYTKEYLSEKDGTFTKFTPILSFAAANTEFPRLMLKRSPSEMVWRMGYKTPDGNISDKSSLNAVMGLSVKDDEGKIRGKRGFILFEEMGNYPNFKEVWDNVRDSVKEGSHVFSLMIAVGCCCKGTVVYDEYGKPLNIEDVVLGDKLSGYDSNGASSEAVTYIQDPAYKECVRIEAQKGVFLECSKDHPILVRSISHDGTGLHVSFKRADEISIGDSIMTSCYIGKFGSVHEDHAYLLGALFGDGNYSTGSSPTLSAPTIEEFEYWKEHYDVGVSKYSKSEKFYAQIYIRGIKWLIRKYGWNGLSKDKKELPFNIFEWDKESLCNFLGGYFNADGNVQIIKNKHRSIKLSCKYEQPLVLVKALLHKLGISSHILKENKPERLLRSNVNKSICRVGPSISYVLYISSSRDIITFRNNIRLIAKNKQERLDSYIPPQRNSVALYDNVRFLYREDFPKGKFFVGKKLSGMMSVTVTAVQDIGVQRIYNLTANTTHTYITNTIISSNTAGDDASDFSGIRTILYNPSAYEVYALENVFDQRGKGSSMFSFFFPSYISRAGCMDKDGNSDVVAALLEILMERWMVKQGGDAASYLKRVAQMPITPAEAILRVQSNMFPVTMLNERVRQIDINPHYYDDVYVGELVDVGGKVTFRKTNVHPIREYPVDNTEPGGLEIFVMPAENNNGKRYVVGVDPVDNDKAESNSLMSIIVFDLYNDEIVAEYTGRQQKAEEGYEIVRLLAIFYNATIMYESNRKLMYAYFSRNHALWMLADCPEWIRAKGLVKYDMYGSSIKGVSVNAPLISAGIDLINDWLKKKKPYEVKDEKGETHIEEIPQLYSIRNRALLQEMISYGPGRNTDRVSALFQVMFYREQFIILYGGAEGVATYSGGSEATDDEFFDRDWQNYQKRFGPQQ